MPSNQPFLPDDGEFCRFRREVEVFQTLTLSVEPKPCVIILKASREQIRISPQAIIQLLTDKFNTPVELPYPLNQKLKDIIHAAELDKNADKNELAPLDKIEVVSEISCPNNSHELSCIPGSSMSTECPIIKRAYFLQWERTLIYAYIKAAKQKLEEQAATAKWQMEKGFKIQLEADKKELKEQIEAQRREIKTLNSSNAKQDNKIKQAEEEIQSSWGACNQFLEEKRKAESAVASKERELFELTKKSQSLPIRNRGHIP